MLGTHFINPPSLTTDPSKLRSLLLNNDKITTLHQGPSYAVQHERCSTGGGVRVTVYGVGSQPDYEQAWQRVLELQPSTESVIKCSAIPAAAVTAAQSVLGKAGFHQVYFSTCFQYIWLLGSEQLRTAHQPQLPAGFCIDSLTPGDAQLVNDTWTYKGPDTLSMVQQLTTSSNTSCVRLIADGRPVSWALEVEPGCVGMLHTLQQYRGKGLARAVLLNLLLKLQVEHEQQESAMQADMMAGSVFCYVVEDNTASISLLESIGLVRSGVFVWMGFEQQQKRMPG